MTMRYQPTNQLESQFTLIWFQSFGTSKSHMYTMPSDRGEINTGCNNKNDTKKKEYYKRKNRIALRPHQRFQSLLTCLIILCRILICDFVFEFGFGFGLVWFPKWFGDCCADTVATHTVLLFDVVHSTMNVSRVHWTESWTHVLCLQINKMNCKWNWSEIFPVTQNECWNLGGVNSAWINNFMHAYLNLMESI